jgi:hypothetical protein
VTHDHRIPESIAKAPKVATPETNPLDVRVQYLSAHLATCVTDAARMRYARQIVETKFERGDYPDLAELDPMTRDHLAKQLLEEKRA